MDTITDSLSTRAVNKSCTNSILYFLNVVDARLTTTLIFDFLSNLPERKRSRKWRDTFIAFFLGVLFDFLDNALEGGGESIR